MKQLRCTARKYVLHLFKTYKFVIAIVKCEIFCVTDIELFSPGYSKVLC